MKKRIFDICASMVVGTLAIPLIAGTTVTVLMTLGRPLFFREQRVGQNGESFTMYKFRTMTDARDEDGQLLPVNQRIPAVLKYIRKSGLDELPQLFNIIRGDMSMVGPRPHSEVEFQHISPAEKEHICSVKPGLTGRTQVLQIHKKVDPIEALKNDFNFAGERTSVRRDLAIMALSTESLVRGHQPLSAGDRTNAEPAPPQ